MSLNKLLLDSQRELIVAQAERVQMLCEAMDDALPMLRMLEKFGEDSVWRPAKRHREAFETALAKARGEQGQ